MGADFAQFLSKSGPTLIRTVSSDREPAKRLRMESEEIPTIAQFSTKPETER